jgi:dTDP-4-dehydrorhamnose reductase
MHIDTLCDIISRCIERRPEGIFNAGCRDSMYKAEFAFCIAKSLRLSTDRFTVGKSSDLALKARRPLDMSLNVSRLENALEMQMPIMRNEIKNAAREYVNE